MFDTMTLTKTVASLCGALLIFLLGGWVAESLYSSNVGHGDEHAQGYVIDTGEEETEVVVDEGPTFPELYASADASAGEKVFRNCQACHKAEDGANGVGPHLYGVVGRDVGSVAGFAYSGALSEVASSWTPEELDAFLENPGDYAPGTSMGYAGLRKPEDRVDVIAYLDDTDGSRTDVAGADMDETAVAAEAPVEEATEEVPAEDAGKERVEDARTAVDATEEDAPAEDATERAAADDAVLPESGQTASAVSDDAASSGAAVVTDMSEFATMVAAADAENGEKLFRGCAACHKVEDGRNGVGPHLYQVVGRDIAALDGFSYSDALTSLEGAWTVDMLDGWLENPREFAPGNRMGYPGLKDMGDRADLVAYLQGTGG